MKILAIEASSLVASVAILTDDIITAEYTINHNTFADFASDDR